MTGIVRRSAARSVAATVGVALLLTLIGYPEARGAEPLPSLKLLSSDDVVFVDRTPGEPAPMDVGTFVAAVGGPFDIRVRKTAKGFTAVQTLPGSTGAKTIRTLTSSMIARDGSGLADFFEITLRRPGGKLVKATKATFCPSAWSYARVTDDSSDLSTYPNQSGCYFSELTQGLVWGVDEGWAIQAPQPYESQVDVPDGTYEVTVQIAKRFRDLFGIAADDARSTVMMHITTSEWPWPEEGEPFTAGAERPGRLARDPNASPTVQEDASGLPDLVALPAFAIHAQHEEGRDVIVFGANVWNAGPGPLVVEGFRRRGAELMDAYQYFYSDGQKTGRELVGTLEYDSRDGHNHWHFTDFARYQLMTPGGENVVRSGKEAFCLAPTDAIDLTVRGANWRPSWTGLSTSCGGPRSIWIREILDPGWGDTYHQWLPGQSFDITGVPNGHYEIEVVTNPDGRLFERTAANNRAITKITIGGTPGARTVRLR